MVLRRDIMDNNVIVGKYTLESLTMGMYTNPFIIYREYIQNSTDAIDEAVRKGIINYENTYINIIINKTESSIIIEDNGIGVSLKDAPEVLLNIGKSNKNPGINKGFRGIGRLGGLSYCDSVIFETSYYGEDTRSIITFDAVRLNRLLIPGEFESYTLSDVIKEVTNIQYRKESPEKHYFRVILKNVNKKYNLLEFDKVYSYIKQVAPVPFDTNKFKYADDIYKKLSELKIDWVNYNIFLGESRDSLKQIYKPYKTRFYTDVSRKVIDSFEGVHFYEITDDYNGKLIALVWYGKCKLLGTVLDEEVKGLRVRKSGIMIGDRFLLNPIFKEERFNGWVQGEVLVFDDNIIPNARRDDFEKNDAYILLMEKLKNIAECISNDIRNASKQRSKQINNMSENKNVTSNDNITKEIISKLDLIIQKATMKDTKLLEQIEKVLKRELDSNKAESILKKIENIV